ncbi:MAG: rRNA cytosine-C5-methyltransferase [Tannerellaceae bacterium]|jgi:16S rRNA C967 or C1407 C5-methylase (RsmB/RsmF family)/NOL1/NOP2/fmu family ribosome biogenesis protein|nr:rRNA cytosine-C5-methyltransferase [Tannerellaceae bacterium]
MNLPYQFAAATKALLGDEYDRFASAMRATPPTSLRLNIRKYAAPPPGAEPVQWCASGYYLPERISFTFDPLFHAGAYYVQEAASMFVAQAVQAWVEGPVRCLDLCAAPGGKSTLLSAVLPAGSLLVCNEAIRSRVGVLAENITKWGNPNAIVINNDPAEIGRQLGDFFDIIVADMPCSGEGMFRKYAKSVDSWSPDLVRLCAARQRRIFADVWDALRPGGLFVYSTCTFNAEENEENIRFMMKETDAEVLSIPIEQSWGVAGNLLYNFPVYRFLPHRIRGEGFFLAALRKPGMAPPRRAKAWKREKSRATAPAQLGEWLVGPEDFELEMRNNIVRALPRIHADDYAFLASQVRTASPGINICELKGKDMVPTHALAMSIALNRNAFQTVEVDLPTAIAYLRKDTLHIDCRAGYVLLTHRGLPLGFAKQLGSRINNLYPPEWRIRQNRPSGDEGG